MIKNKLSKSLLTDLQCFANINYYINLEKYHELTFEQYEHFQKRSYSNRYYIAGANGRLLLSIPLLHSRRERTAIKDLKICNRDRWQALHWKTLISAYRRSPWFEFYEQELSVMYNKKYKFILDWNLDTFNLVGLWLGKNWTVNMTSSYEIPTTIPDVADERHRFVPPKKEGTGEGYHLYYPQVFEDRNGFIPDLSILDLLFCEGNNAGKLLAEKSAKD